MNNNHYSDMELHLMSYQDLRRLSISMQLPANIKKKYMISMIQAHQKGDGCMKTAIANKVMEERKIKRLNSKKKQSKSYILGSSINTEQELLDDLKRKYKKRIYKVRMCKNYKASAFCWTLSKVRKLRLEFYRPAESDSKFKRSKPEASIQTRKKNFLIPTDLSVSTQHEIETRVSYIAHYSSKDDISSGISRIIKQEAEVSRRNRSILQQPRKPTRKLSTVGRTEIMLPRNHSLTTPVRLMPQYERGYPSPTDYDSMSGLSNGKTHFQDINYNYYFHGEFSNSLMPTTSHEMYRSEPYWHTRDMYNNSLMPILSNLLTPSSVTINSSSYASQYASSNSLKGSSSFQGVYENYIKSNSIIESQAFQSSVTNSSTLIVNNHHTLNENNGSNYNVSAGSYLLTKSDVDFELSSAANDLNCHHCAKRNDAIIRSSTENQGFLEFYPRHGDSSSSPQTAYVTNSRDAPSQYNSCRTENKEMTLPLLHRPFESPSMITYKSSEILDTDLSTHENAPQTTDGYESSCTEEDKLWEESDHGLKKMKELNPSEKESFADGFLSSHGQGSNLSEISDTSTNFSADMETSDKHSKTNEKEIPTYTPNFFRCRYTSGHNKYPEAVSDSNRLTTLPSFLSTFCTNEFYNRAYSLCKNSVTGTTETHLNPIMTSTYASQFSSHTNSQPQINNTGNESQIQRQWYYTYPESQLPFPMDTTAYTAWNEYPNEMDNKLLAANNHNVQVVKCRTHGCHYLYSISNPCD